MALELTVREAAVLSGIAEGRIRKDIEHGVCGAGTPPRLEVADVIYLCATVQLGIRLNVADRKRFHQLIWKKMARDREFRTPLEVGSIVLINLRELFASVGERASRFADWKRRRVVSRDDVLGGEPIFRNSRLSVRHVGAMLSRGASRGEVLEDYPYLRAEDLEFAKLYAEANPRVGRPRSD